MKPSKIYFFPFSSTLTDLEVILKTIKTIVRVLWSDYLAFFLLLLNRILDLKGWKFKNICLSNVIKNLSVVHVKNETC